MSGLRWRCCVALLCLLCLMCTSISCGTHHSFCPSLSLSPHVHLSYSSLSPFLRSFLSFFFLFFAPSFFPSLPPSLPLSLPLSFSSSLPPSPPPQSFLSSSPTQWTSVLTQVQTSPSPAVQRVCLARPLIPPGCSMESLWNRGT